LANGLIPKIRKMISIGADIRDIAIGKLQILIKKRIYKVSLLADHGKKLMIIVKKIIVDGKQIVGMGVKGVSQMDGESD